MTSSTLLPLSALGFFVWAVYLGGLASLQALCADNSPAYNTLYLTGAMGFNAAASCSRVYAFYWFIMSFEFVGLIGMAIAAVTNVLPTYRQSFLGIFSVLCLLYINASNAFLDASYLDWYQSEPQLSRNRTATAGVIMTAVINGFIIIALGLSSAEAAATPAAETHKSAGDVEAPVELAAVKAPPPPAPAAPAPAAPVPETVAVVEPAAATAEPEAKKEEATTSA